MEIGYKGKASMIFDQTTSFYGIGEKISIKILPIDLVNSICQHLSLDEYKLFRFTCKHFESILPGIPNYSFDRYRIITLSMVEYSRSQPRMKLKFADVSHDQLMFLVSNCHESEMCRLLKSKPLILSAEVSMS